MKKYVRSLSTHFMLGKPEEADSTEEASTFRTILPQVLASTAKNFLLFDLGLAVAFPTIVIPALRGTIENLDNPETLFFTEEQASWFASIAFICQPVGSVLSGLITEPIGRKKSMILVNIPHIIGWLMLAFATSLTELYIAVILLGLGVGFMEAPIVTYVGEISQPSIRGILTSCAGVSASLGVFLIYFLSTVCAWRTVALICLAVPIFTVVAILFVPETPMWLLSRNREDDALKSLQWLRGWVSAAAVDKEFKDMKRYSENSNKCIKCQKSDLKCTHPRPSFIDKLKELRRKRTMKPFILVMMLFGICQFSGVNAMRPYLVQLFQAYGVNVDAQYGTVIFGLVGLVANIIAMIVVKYVGKRNLFLFSIVGTATSTIALGIFAYTKFPYNWSSFDNHANIGENSLPMILFCIISFSANIGLTPVPWMILSEVFPFKSRGIATGIAAALNYVLTFIATKTYLYLEKGLYLYGSSWFYGILGILGFVVTYFYLPETEDRTLEDIEKHFSENSVKMSNINIRKIKNIEMELKIIEAKVMEDNTNPDGFDNKAFTAI